MSRAVGSLEMPNDKGPMTKEIPISKSQPEVAGAHYAVGGLDGAGVAQCAVAPTAAVGAHLHRVAGASAVRGTIQGACARPRFGIQVNPGKSKVLVHCSESF